MQSPELLKPGTQAPPGRQPLTQLWVTACAKAREEALKEALHWVTLLTQPLFMARASTAFFRATGWKAVFTAPSCWVTKSSKDHLGKVKGKKKMILEV